MGDGFRIRVLGREVHVGSREELHRLLRLGRIGPATEVYDPDKRVWGTVGALDDVTSDAELAWNAWEQAEHTDPGLGLPVVEDEPTDDAVPVPNEEDEPTRDDDSWTWLGDGSQPIEEEDEPSIDTVPDVPIEEQLFETSINEPLVAPEISSDGAPTPQIRRNEPGPKEPVPSAKRPVRATPKRKESVEAPDSVGLPLSQRETLIREEAAEPMERPIPSADPTIEDLSVAMLPQRIPTGATVGPQGNVIAFPSRRSGAHALAEQPMMMPVESVPQVEPPRRLRMGVVLLAFIGGLAALGFWFWYVDTMTEVSPEPVFVGSVGHNAPPDVRRVSGSHQELSALHESLVDQLPDVRTIDSESGFENAVHAELVTLGIDVLEVDTEVISWSYADDAKRPQVVSFRIRLTPQQATGLSNQEQAAIAIVTGRYIERYRLVVTGFVVVSEPEEGLPRTIPVDATQVQSLAAGIIELGEYLRVQ